MAKRPDKEGSHRAQFEKNKRIIYATQSVCGICGQPVDPAYKFPHPLSRCIDHIVPVARGGHPSDIDNLQLAHFTCNRAKSDKLIGEKTTKDDGVSEVVSNRVLPWSRNWLDGDG